MNAQPARGSFFDSFSNFLSGLGVWGRDKAIAQTPVLHELNVKELVDLYRGDWLGLPLGA